MAIIKTVSEWLREKFGMDPKVVSEAASLIEQAMANVTPVTSKEVAAQNRETVEKLNFDLLGSFPLKDYVLYLQKTPEFPSFDTTLADVEAQQAATRAGIEYNLPNYSGCSWSADYTKARANVARHVTMAHFNSAKDMGGERERTKRDYERLALMANATGDARIIAAFNAGCDHEVARLARIETADKVKNQVGGEREAEQAERDASIARRGGKKTMDEQLDELRDLMAKQARLGEERSARFEDQLSKFMDILVTASAPRSKKTAGDQ